jgi:trk system potassium uptake protein TrkA
MKIIIYGANEIGSMIATEFFEDHDIIVIDPDSNSLENFSKLDVASINANATDVSALKEAGIKSSDVFIACTNNDEANIAACIMAKYLERVQSVCFVSKKETRDSLRTMRSELNPLHCTFIDHIIWPEKLLTQEIFQIIAIPEAINVENFAQGKARLLEYRIKENSILLNKKIKDCHFSEETLIVGVVKSDELFIPDGLTELNLNDKVIFMGTPEGLDITASSLFTEQNKIKRVMIIGGGSVGFELAQSLSKTTIKAKVIEKDYKRCEFLSEKLHGNLILNGDGTDIELLTQEGTGECDVAVCVTDSDEKNLLCALLAKQLGAKRIIARAGKAVTAKLFEKVGVDIAISPKQASVEEIKNRIVESKNQILATVESGLGEVIQIDINNNFKDTAIMDLGMPRKAVIGIIERQSKIIIPKGQTLIRSSDKIIIFTKAEDVEAVRNYFKV